MKFLVLLAVLPFAYSLSTGAPALACVSLTPAHGGGTPPGPNPISIFLSTLNVAPGGTVSVQVVSTEPFRGFLIQPRVVGATNVSPGTFQATTSSQNINCQGGFQNSATHVINTPRNSETVVWNAPTTFSGQIRFHITIVRDFANYWVDNLSAIVTVG